MRFALELFEHALEHYVGKEPIDRKMSVLHLAQVCELAVKAALVERNILIYEKDGRTVTVHAAQEKLSVAWGVTPLPFQSRVQLLVDDRNSIQHKYGTVDEVALDYHLETAVEFLAEIFRRAFNTNLREYVRDTIAEDVWSEVRVIVSGMPPRPIEGSAAIVAGSGTMTASGNVVVTPAPAELKLVGYPPEVFIAPSSDDKATRFSAVLRENATGTSKTTAFLNGFSWFERTVTAEVWRVLGENRNPRSLLDVLLKFVANLQGQADLAGHIPAVFKLRNATVHNTSHLDETGAQRGVDVLAAVIDLVADPSNAAIFKAAVEASEAGIRGTRLRVPPATDPPAAEGLPVEPGAAGKPDGIGGADGAT